MILNASQPQKVGRYYYDICFSGGNWYLLRQSAQGRKSAGIHIQAVRFHGLLFLLCYAAGKLFGQTRNKVIGDIILINRDPYQ